ncbi:hypothetical protein BT69DRAFT_36526 [Atractiella rhizophila]|nr:hypothetical protein BT69DRAFT_36526 [Atractiella rhizophila]
MNQESWTPMSRSRSRSHYFQQHDPSNRGGPSKYYPSRGGSGGRGGGRGGGYDSNSSFGFRGRGGGAYAGRKGNGTYPGPASAPSGGYYSDLGASSYYNSNSAYEYSHVRAQDGEVGTQDDLQKLRRLKEDIDGGTHPIYKPLNGGTEVTSTMNGSSGSQSQNKNGTLPGQQQQSQPMSGGSRATETKAREAREPSCEITGSRPAPLTPVTTSIGVKVEPPGPSTVDEMGSSSARGIDDFQMGKAEAVKLKLQEKLSKERGEVAAGVNSADGQGKGRGAPVACVEGGIGNGGVGVGVGFNPSAGKERDNANDAGRGRGRGRGRGNSKTPTGPSLRRNTAEYSLPPLPAFSASQPTSTAPAASNANAQDGKDGDGERAIDMEIDSPVQEPASLGARKPHAQQQSQFRPQTQPQTAQLKPASSASDLRTWAMRGMDAPSSTQPISLQNPSWHRKSDNAPSAK